MGIVLDIEGNCRFYDLIRLRKMAKITTSSNSVKSLVASSKDLNSDGKSIGPKKGRGGEWRVMPSCAIDSTFDAFLAVT